MSIKTLKTLCIFHEEKTPSLIIDEHVYYCFSCGEHGLTKDSPGILDILNSSSKKTNVVNVKFSNNCTIDDLSEIFKEEYIKLCEVAEGFMMLMDGYFKKQHDTDGYEKHILCEHIFNLINGATQLVELYEKGKIQ
jgi:hypothetical protein